MQMRRRHENVADVRKNGITHTHVMRMNESMR